MHHNHKVEEFLALIEQYWKREPELSLVQFLQATAERAGAKEVLADVSDDVLFYQLKMQNESKNDAIPGIKKDYQDDFKTALLKARGLL